MRKEWIFGRMAFCIALLLFFLSPLAMAMDIVYDGRLGDGYGKVLSMEEGLSSFHVRKNSSYVLEIMNQDDVAAVETYDFQARSLMTNRIMPLYWYPHYTVTMVLAVADGIPYEVKDWKDLTVYPLTVGIPVDTVTRDLSMMSFFYGLSGEMDLSAGVEALKKIHQEGRLRLDARYAPGYYLQTSRREEADVYIVPDVEARRWVWEGRPFHLVYPERGTLSFKKGLLSKEPLVIDEKHMASGLWVKGYALEHHGRTIPPDEMEDFLNEIDRGAYELKFKILAPYSIQSLLPVPTHMMCFAMLFLTVIWGRRLRRRMKGKEGEWIIFSMACLCFLWLFFRTIIADLPQEMVTIRRYNWYSYYVYLALLTILILCLAVTGSRDRGKGVYPLWLKGIALFDIALSLVVMTNDFHGAAFSFPEGLSRGVDIHSYGWGYYGLAAAYAGELLALVGWLVHRAVKNHVGNITIFLPVAELILYLLYVAAYALGMKVAVATDFTLITVFSFLLWIEWMIDSHMIEGNGSYEDFFNYSSLALAIKDSRGRTLYHSVGPRMRKEDCEVKILPVQGGTALWYRNVKEIREKRRQMGLVNQALRRTADMLEKEGALRRSYIRLATEWKIYRELETIVKRKSRLILRYASFLQHARPGNEADEAVFRLNVLACYVKRRCILFLKGAEGGKVDCRDFQMAAEELFRYLSPRGIRAVLHSEGAAGILPASSVLTFYDFLEEYLEDAVLAGVVHISCHLDIHPHGSRLSLMAGESYWVESFMKDMERDSRFTKDGISIGTRDLGYSLCAEICITYPEEKTGRKEKDHG